MEERKELTKRQEEVLNYIKKYIAEHGYPPAVREICAGIGLNSPATVFVHIKNLESLGVIRQTSNKFRTIELLVENEYEEKNEDVIKVPLLGKITAGNPITAIEQPDEFFDLPAALMPKSGEVFTLHVSGESMINRGIFDNDYVIVKRQQNAKNGDIVSVHVNTNAGRDIVFGDTVVRVSEKYALAMHIDTDECNAGCCAGVVYGDIVK